MQSGRVTLYRNGSLLIKNVTKKDAGVYTLETFKTREKVESTTTTLLHVHAVLWTCGRHDTSGQLTIVAVPPRIAEGGSVLLSVRNPPENILFFFWYKWINEFKRLNIVRYRIDKKLIVWESAYGGREILYSDGSLLLHNITQKDPGLYTLRIFRTDMGFEEADVKLYVDSK
ncbi:carcinoembryonic antigen-related cell adhesion molecule 3-like [Sigmodon hispidus]